MLLTYTTIPKETFTERLRQLYYDTVTLQISNLVRFPGGHILAEKVFGQMKDENVVSLVQNMLIDPTYHVVLRQLHDTCRNVYWNNRLRSVKKLCPTWDLITIPDTVGLIQFAQLCLRRMNILQRKSPVVEIDLTCAVYEQPLRGSLRGPDMPSAIDSGHS